MQTYSSVDRTDGRSTHMIHAPWSNFPRGQSTDTCFTADGRAALFHINLRFLLLGVAWRTPPADQEGFQFGDRVTRWASSSYHSAFSVCCSGCQVGASAVRHLPSAILFGVSQTCAPESLRSSRRAGSHSHQPGSRLPGPRRGRQRSGPSCEPARPLLCTEGCRHRPGRARPRGTRRPGSEG